MNKHITKYHIAKYDYATKRQLAFKEKYTNAFAALNALFVYVINYLQSQDGYEKVKDSENFKSFMFDKKKFRSALKATLAPGHYIVRDPDSHVYKLEIWQKYTVTGPGMIFGTYIEDKWKKVFDIDIFEVSELTEELSEWIGMEKHKEIFKEDIKTASKLWKQLNETLIKLECFKKIRETTENKLSILKKDFFSEFGNFVKKSKAPEKSLSESVIFEVNSEGSVNTYKTALELPKLLKSVDHKKTPKPMSSVKTLN